MAFQPKMLLCRWCRECIFNENSMGALGTACMGDRRRQLVKHVRSQEAHYFWTSKESHSGFPETFAASFRSIQKDARAGCIFCSLLVAAAENVPPKWLSHCFFEGPRAAFPDIDKRSEALLQLYAHATKDAQDYLDSLGSDWPKHYTYADRVRGSIEAGLPRESLLTAYKVRDSRLQIRRDGAENLTQHDPAFAFTLVINEPWEYSTVCWPYHEGGPDAGVEFSRHYFKLYLTEPRSHWRNLTSATEESTLQHVNALWKELGDESRPLAALARDGKIFRALLEDCAAHHAPCTLHSAYDLPARLLVVSGTMETPLLRLVDVVNIQASDLRYACLSYCWGGPQPGMTTTAQLPKYYQNIDGSDGVLIAKTVKDAARVTLSLGLGFLWVDAYCIVQDSGGDKINELNKMASIYRGAFCTIAVMSSKSSADGFLELDQRAVDDPMTLYFDIENAVVQQEFGRDTPRCAILEMRKDYAQRILQDEPLVARAWTLQEALLSPRLLMYFSDGQRPALRCADRIVRPDGAIVTHIPKELGTLSMTLSDDTRGADGHLAQASRLWHEIVQEYAKRSLTSPTDRLPALMGVVVEMETHKCLGDYICGMWSKTLKEDLLWRVVGRDPIFHALEETGPRQAYEVYLGPSWSWVSRKHPVYYGNDFNDSADVSVVSYSVVPADSLLPSGALESARLTVSCPSLEVQVADDWVDGAHSFFFDDKPRQMGLGKMWLLEIMSEEPYNNSHAVGLGVIEAIGPSTSIDKFYRRVGMFQRGAGPTHEKQEWTKRTFTLI